MKKWLDYRFSTGCTTGDDYKKFQMAYRNYLKKALKEVGFTQISFLKGHYEFSAVYQHENGKYVYVSISDVRFWPNEWYNRILYRTMEHPKDWHGGANRRCSLDELPSQMQYLADRAR